MSKLALIFFFLLFVPLIHAGFPRPWENRTWITSNPSILTYGIDIWWNLPELDKTLQSLELEKIDANGTAGAHLEEAIKRKNLAKKSYQDCRKASAIAPLWLIPATFPLTLIFTFSSITSCMTYQPNWVRTIDFSLKAIEQSGKDAKNSIDASRRTYDEIKSLGLCDVNFTYRASEYCENAGAAFITIDDDITEGKYGTFPLFLDYSEQLEHELIASTPDLSAINIMLALIWSEGGTIDAFDDLSYRAKTAEEDAEKQFEALLSTAQGRSDILKGNLAEMERQKLHLITRATSGFEAHRTDSIATLLEDLKQGKNDIDIKSREAALQRDRIFEKSYLAVAITNIADAANQCQELIKESTELLDDARQTVMQQRTEAESLIEDIASMQNPSTDTAKYLEEAKRAFEQGELAKSLGERFIRYSEAAELARQAAEQRNYEGQLLAQSLLSRLKEIIKNAKKDGINVVTEEKELELLDKLEPYQMDAYAQSAMANIVSKAKIKFEADLLGMRASITDKLSSAGPAASDLYTELERCEQGIVVNSQIVYPDAIGKLKELMKGYQYLEDELSQHMGDVIGNAMSSRAIPMVSEVALDKPAEITLDLVLTNPKKYGGENIGVSVALPSEIPLLYSDIVFGADSVESLYHNGENLILTFNNIAPFETTRVVLNKEIVIAHTLSKDIESTGVGDGAAYTRGALDFELDMDIPHLKLPQGLTHALIDGSDPSRELRKGKHELTFEGITQEAYEESIRDIKSYSMGLNSRVEYDIEIIPAMDLKSVPVFIDALNHSQLSSLNVFAATGENVKGLEKLSETQYGAKVTNLKKDVPSILKVSFLVENTESFVKSQISQFENIEASTNAKNLLEQAKIQSNAGNHTIALEHMEKFKAIIKEEEKTNTKLQKKYEDLHKELMNELDGISEIRPDPSLNSSFIAKLSARNDELSRITEELTTSNLSQKVDLLEKVDFKWAEKELKSLKKDVYKEYNNLKERFFLAGNSTTPRQFLEFEDALNKLEVGLRLEYAIETIQALDVVKEIVISQENRHFSDKEALRLAFEKLKSETEDALGAYTKQASAAKGTEYSSLFTETERRVNSLIKDADSSLDEDSRVLRMKLNDLNKSKGRMETTLDSLKNESQAKLSLIETLVRQSNPDNPKAAEIQTKLNTMRNMHESGDYVNALRAGSAIAKELDSYEKPESNSLLILGITALAVLAAIGAYIIKQQKPKKEFRKLPKTEETEED